MFDRLSAYLKTKADFTNEELKQVQKCCTPLYLNKGEKLLEAGTVWKYHAFVCSGIARGYITDQWGAERTVLFAPENYWTGDRESLLTGNPATVTVITEEPTHFMLISQENYNDLCVKSSSFCTFMSNLVQRNLSARVGAVSQQTLSDKEKLHAFLNRYPGVIQRVPLSTVASYLAMNEDLIIKFITELS